LKYCEKNIVSSTKYPEKSITLHITTPKHIKMAYRINLSKIERIIYQNEPIDLKNLPIEDVKKSYAFLETFAQDKIIYGINTGFGPMAQWRVEDQSLKDLQYNIIRSHATGAGNPLPDKDVKAAMLARLCTFLQAKSGVHPQLIELLTSFINHEIIPFVPQHGSVGASGDLVQLAHIALTMIGEGKVHYKGEWLPASDVLHRLNIQPLNIYIREGLALTNGTSVMLGIAANNQLKANALFDYALLASLWINEIAQSYDDFMAQPLNACRQQTGQQIIAQQLRNLSQSSSALLKREHALYDKKHVESTFEHKVQPYYSLRCVPQIFGPIYDTMRQTQQVIENEFASASDNPIVDEQTKNVYHGGNFHGDYISLEQDKLKIVLTRLAMTAERQLNYLLHDRINNILPPFLNLGILGLNYGLQASQFTATSTTAECQTLAMPNYVHSISNNNDNQDIVSMGTNSALICQHVVENAWQVLTILMAALAQATDCLKCYDQLCDASKATYDLVRNILPTIVEDHPLYDKLAQIEQRLKQHPLRLNYE